MNQCADRRRRSVRHLLLILAVVSPVAALTSSLPATSGDSRLLASSESTVDGVATVATGAVIEMTGHSPEGAVLHRSFTGTDWTEWSSLGGVLTSRPDLASWIGGRLDVFARGVDRAAWRRSRDGGVWGPWESLGGQLTSAPAAV